MGHRKCLAHQRLRDIPPLSSIMMHGYTQTHTHVVYCTVTMLSEAEESTSYGDSERTRGREE